MLASQPFEFDLKRSLRTEGAQCARDAGSEYSGTAQPTLLACVCLTKRQNPDQLSTPALSSLRPFAFHRPTVHWPERPRSHPPRMMDGKLDR